MCASRDDSCRVNVSNGLLLYYHQYSFYSQKVLLALHEKNLPFESHIVDLLNSEQYDPWFLHLNPRGEVPVLQDGGKIISDSARIIDYLDDKFSGENIGRLIPMDEGPETRQKVTSYRQILDQIPAGVITMGSFYHPELVGRPKAPFFGPVRKLLKNSEQKSVETLTVYAENNPGNRNSLEQKMELQEKKHHIVADKNEFLNVLKQVEDTFDKVEKELSTHNEDTKGWWLCSKTYSAADISLTILLERLNQLGFEDRFWKNARRPHIEDYYARVQTRSSYKKSVPNMFFHVRMFARSQKPLVIGVTTATVVLVFVGGYYIIKKTIS